MLLLNQYTYLYTLNESKTCVIYAFVTLTSLLCTAVYSYYWPLLVVSWEGSSEKEELSAPLQKSSYYTKCSFELSLLSACFSCLKSAFPPENCFALCRDEKLGEMTGLALDNKEECQVWEGLETYASLNSALCRSQRGMKFLWNRIEGQACKEKKQQHAASFLRKRMLSLPAPPPEAAISDSWDKTNCFFCSSFLSQALLAQQLLCCSARGQLGAQGGAFQLLPPPHHLSCSSVSPEPLLSTVCQDSLWFSIHFPLIV